MNNSELIVQKIKIDILVDELDWLANFDIKDIINTEKMMSAEQNSVLKIESKDGNYILKIGPNLEEEYERLVWLEGKLPVAKVIGWEKGEQDKLLMSYISGENLAEIGPKLPEEELVKILADALHLVHNIDIKDCPFGKRADKSVLIHGDSCLPNFMIKDGKLTGIIDLGSAGLGDEDDDLAATVWSLNHNLGPNAGLLFLKAYGYEVQTKEEVERLRLKYEGDWSERFED